jgi:hypothetical protein
MLYGFPTAGVLIKALQGHQRSNEPLPYEGSRSKLIRNLSVFVSHLESIPRLGNAKFGLLSRASKAFSEILDEILEPKTAGDGSEVDMLASVADLGDVDLLDTMDFGVMFDQWLV